jgi:ABC-type uncharacterized transport system substrate-binding protein
MARAMRQNVFALFNALVIICALTIPVNAAFADSALVIRGKTDVFNDVVRGMKDDLEGELDIEELIATKDSSPNEISSVFARQKPKVVILLGNKSINLYAKFQKSHKDKQFPPAIATAASFVDKFVSKLDNAVGIRYEIPAVTSAVAMRNILKKPVKKIGVIYREWMADIIKQNQEFCAAEGIELVGIELENNPDNTTKEVKKALAKLEDSVDALWILNDNALLMSKKDPALIRSWMTMRMKSKIPAIVGIQHFLKKIPLGSFAIVPDNYGLGAQTAGIIFELMDNDWEIDDTDVQQPVSVKKSISVLTLEKKGISYKKSSLNQVDHVVK